MKDERDRPLHHRTPAQNDRIQALRRQINQLPGVRILEDDLATGPAEVEESFLQRVLNYETSEKTTLQAILTARGHSIPSPDCLEDDRLTEELWKLIRALADLRVYLDCTDHLSDRQLYEYLCGQALLEEDIYVTEDPDWFCHLDPIGTGSAEDTEIYLRYYADEFWRNQWREEFPEDDLPERQPPPYDRDRRLPRPSQFP